MLFETEIYIDLEVLKQFIKKQNMEAPITGGRTDGGRNSGSLTVEVMLFRNKSLT